ncbi:hypothetical protein E5D57_009068 [Metarhizium anisopliae]|nr:hypothetical protein E5D57_009068 [Metarhizium anisopliae]
MPNSSRKRQVAGRFKGGSRRNYCKSNARSEAAPSPPCLQCYTSQTLLSLTTAAFKHAIGLGLRPFSTRLNSPMRNLSLSHSETGDPVRKLTILLSDSEFGTTRTSHAEIHVSLNVVRTTPRDNE